MVRRTAQFYTYGSDGQCLELMKYLEEAGIRLDIRDIEKEPLTAYELRKIVGYNNIYHFLNPLSPSFDKHDLGEKNMDKEEVFELVLKDYTLLRRPLVRTSRLTTIGCDKKILDSVLQIGMEATRPVDVGNRMTEHHGRSSSPRPTRPKGGSQRTHKGSRPRGLKGSNGGRSGQLTAGR